VIDASKGRHRRRRTHGLGSSGGCCTPLLEQDAEKDLEGDEDED
jgi:hypothetical protein